MYKQKREKLTVTTTPEKTHPQQPFVQVEGKLTEEQLEAIAGGIGGDDEGDTGLTFPVIFSIERSLCLPLSLSLIAR